MVRHGRRDAFWSRLAGVGARRCEAPHAQPAHCPAAPAVTQFGGIFATSRNWRQIVCGRKRGSDGIPFSLYQRIGLPGSFRPDSAVLGCGQDFQTWVKANSITPDAAPLRLGGRMSISAKNLRKYHDLRK